MSVNRVLGLELNRAELSEFFGIAMTTVDNWVRAGCPVVKRGGRGVAWVFNSADVAAWREGLARQEVTGTADDSFDDLKRRKLAAETVQAELALAKAKGDVAPVSEFREVIQQNYVAFRQNMRSVPAKISLVLVGRSVDEMQQILQKEIDNALRRLVEGLKRDFEAQRRELMERSKNA